jgi:hypothetical protein
MYEYGILKPVESFFEKGEWGKHENIAGYEPN